MGLSFPDPAAGQLSPLDYWMQYIKKFLILPSAARYIFRKESKGGGEKAEISQRIKDAEAGEADREGERPVYNNQRVSQLIGAVSALHKFSKPIQS
jgi:hypothetical protein